MGTHLIPRSNVKGQDRLFIIFSTQGLLGTLIGIAIYSPIGFLLSLFTDNFLVIYGLGALFGAIGFVIGQVKVPDNNGSPLFKKLGGLYIRDAIIAYFKFQQNKKKYVLQVSEDDVFAEHKESSIEKIILNKKDDSKSQATE